MVDHASWFAGGRPFVLVGHSAGGGIALESAVELQQSGKAPLAVLLLDGVGWPATDEVAGKFSAVDTRLWLTCRSFGLSFLHPGWGGVARSSVEVMAES